MRVDAWLEVNDKLDVARSAHCSEKSSMPQRSIPCVSDFPASTRPVLVSTSKPCNVVLFLPGLGDTSENFSRFAQALNLPGTLCLTLQGADDALTGITRWSDDLKLDSATGELDLDAGFSSTCRVIGEDVIKKLLIEKCCFSAAEVMIFGSGQGGMAALAVAKSLGQDIRGVISIGGPLPSSSMLVNGPKIGTPVLLLGGSKGALTHGSVDETVRSTFEQVNIHLWKKSDDSAPRDRDEALPMMQFFARRLRSHKGVPEGAVEL